MTLAKAISQLVCFVFLCCLASGAQIASSVPDAQAVTVGASKTVAIEGSVMHGTYCDVGGNMYVPVASSLADEIFLEQVGPHDFKRISFPIHTQRSTYMGFGQDGTVFTLVTGGHVITLLRFTLDGKLKSSFQVRRWTIGWPVAAKVALFPDGKSLVAFRGDLGAMHTGIFDEKGTLLTWVELPDDTEIERAVKNHDSRYADPADPDINKAVDLGAAAAGPDGNVYLLRWANPAIVYAIASSGKVVRRLEIEPPLDNLMPFYMQVMQGRVVLQFSEFGISPRTAVSVHDWETGARLKLYDVSNAPGVLGCYNPVTDELTLVGSGDHQMLIQQVRPAAIAQNH